MGGLIETHLSCVSEQENAGSPPEGGMKMNWSSDLLETAKKNTLNMRT